MQHLLKILPSIYIVLFAGVIKYNFDTPPQDPNVSNFMSEDLLRNRLFPNL